MATPVAPRTLYAGRLESAIGTLLLIHDRKRACAMKLNPKMAVEADIW